MSPAEYLELRQLGLDGVASHAMNAVSILFAYLLAMYFAGKRLTTFQLVSVTVIYSIFLVFPVLATTGGLLSLVAINTEFLREYSGLAATHRAPEAVATLNVIRIVMLGVFFFAYVLSILFMLSVRRDKHDVPYDT
tara:strand:- start:98 stop:505 length:408 start_codon:yes stop_codon:yes gene_type:complete